VYRLTPVIGHCYYWAEANPKLTKNGRFYSTVPPKCVGELVKDVHTGCGDGGKKTSIFVDRDGKVTEVCYSYDGLTCFIEVERVNDNIEIVMN